jgi:hypothetical protein
VVNRRGSPDSARIAAAPTGGDPDDRGDQVSQLELVEDRDHPGLGVYQPVLVLDPIGEQQLHALERTQAMLEHASAAGQRSEQFPHDPQRHAFAVPPPIDFTSHGLLEPG